MEKNQVKTESVEEELSRIKTEAAEWKAEALTSRMEKQNMAQRNAQATAEAVYWQTQANILNAKLAEKVK